MIKIFNNKNFKKIFKNNYYKIKKMNKKKIKYKYLKV